MHPFRVFPSWVTEMIMPSSMLFLPHRKRLQLSYLPKTAISGKRQVQPDPGLWLDLGVIRFHC